MAGSYVPSPNIASLWNLANKSAQVPYAGGMEEQHPYQANQYGMGYGPPPNLAAWSDAQALNPNMPIAGDPAAARRAYAAQIQRQAQLNAGAAQGRAAVEQLKRQQWIDGTRTLADEGPGGQLPEAYQRGYLPPVGPNGVRNGVAFRNGVPVGFQGAVPGVETDVGFTHSPGRLLPNGEFIEQGEVMPIPGTGHIPIGGSFAGPDQAAFQKALWNKVQQGTAGYGYGAHPMDRPVAQVPIAPEVMQAQAEQQVKGMTPAQYATMFGAASPSRLAMDALTRGVAQEDATPPDPMKGMTFTQRRDFLDNIQRGREGASAIEKFEQSLPDILPAIAEEYGFDVTPEKLAEEIIATKDKPIPWLDRDPIRVLLRTKTGLDHKLQLRWAQDYLKKIAKKTK